MKSSAEDIILIERLQKGDVEAFDLIYDRYSGKLFSFGFKYLRSRDEAKELVQSVFVKIWENRKSLKKESSFRSFIFTIAYNEICKLFRRRYYFQKYISETAEENAQSSVVVEEGIAFSSVIDRVRKIVSMLPERHRKIFVKSREEGKTSKEIATELDLSPGTVDNYISEALKLIRSRLSKEDLTIFLMLILFFI